jgi:type II secretory pathway component GspD/PulD (secretin)
VSWLKTAYLALALGLSAFANAQERNINLAYREADIRLILQQLGRVTNLPVVMLKGVEGRASLVANGPMTVDEFRSAVLSLLMDLGFEVNERGGALVVGPIEH